NKAMDAVNNMDNKMEALNGQINSMSGSMNQMNQKMNTLGSMNDQMGGMNGNTQKLESAAELQKLGIGVDKALGSGNLVQTMPLAAAKLLAKSASLTQLMDLVRQTLYTIKTLTTSALYYPVLPPSPNPPPPPDNLSDADKQKWTQNYIDNYTRDYNLKA